MLTDFSSTHFILVLSIDKQLEFMISKIFSNLNESMIMWFLRKQDSSKVIAAQLRVF